MDKKLKKHWLAALESDEYNKTKGVLCRKRKDGEHGFCCLGVLGNVMIEDGLIDAEWLKSPQSSLYFSVTKPNGNVEQQRDLLPTYVAKEAGIDIELQGRLADLNDSHNTFKEVIEYIQKEVV